MDEEFFASLEEANYECHESPTKKPSSCSALSESTILHKHLEQRRALRTKVIVALSVLVLAGVGSAALYSSVDLSVWVLKMQAPCPMFRGSSVEVAATASPGKVFDGDNDSPYFGDAILADGGAGNIETQDDAALDDLLLEELDPYEEFHETGRQLEHK
ncbi:Transcription initiation factor TFIID subunit 2 [Phytophthora cinnamomi]|uniref:Transcription initiation factor TFIID subunit 2 n=1 Tax=Phytophthora cinnamomi TaxID=4785 RepID=UPI0035598768|nr:Transcription initiation factor TFIID subunit 2 [Phytophthora cinnamomi]